MIEFNKQDLINISNALASYTTLSSERTQMCMQLSAVISKEISRIEELEEFADECEGGACKL